MRKTTLSEFKQLQPGDPLLGEASVFIGTRPKPVPKFRAQLERETHQDWLDSRAQFMKGCWDVETAMLDQKRDGKLALLDRGRTQVVTPPEQPTDPTPAESKPVLDLTGTSPIPKFRDRWPDEDQRGWLAARFAFVTAWLDNEATRLGRDKKPQQEHSK